MSSFLSSRVFSELPVVFLTLFAGAAAVAEEQGIAPGKFIPTFAVKYGGTTGWPPAEEAARFDLIDVSADTAHARVHASAEGNTWQTLKSLNPHIKVFLYKNGAGLYNTSSWGQLGRGWDWLIQHRGINSSDRWAAVGATHGGYLQGKPLCSYTAGDHRQRLENVSICERGIRSCLRKHLITSYLPGQAYYNLGEYPCRKPWEPGEGDQQELDRLKDSVKRLRITAQSPLPASLDIPGTLRCEVDGHEALVSVRDLDEEVLEGIRRRWSATVQVRDLNLEDIFLEMHHV